MKKVTVINVTVQTETIINMHAVDVHSCCLGIKTRIYTVSSTAHLHTSVYIPSDVTSMYVSILTCS
jgi:hypothetical protein